MVSNFQEIFLRPFPTTFSLTVWPYQKFVAYFLYSKLRSQNSSKEIFLINNRLTNKLIKLNNIYKDKHIDTHLMKLCFKFQVNRFKIHQDTVIQSFHLPFFYRTEAARLRIYFSASY